jgi:5'-nucleotidase
MSLRAQQHFLQKKRRSRALGIFQANITNHSFYSEEHLDAILSCMLEFGKQESKEVRAHYIQLMKLNNIQAVSSDSDPIILFDVDGTLYDYENAIARDYNEIASPEDPVCSYDNEKYPHLKKRIDYIRRTPGWWLSLEKLQLGWDVYEMAKEIGLIPHVLTQGPRNCPNAWSEKLQCVERDLPQVDITVTRNKGLFYGRVLVDDYPSYIEAWLKHRPRGRVIMPAHSYNKDFTHPNVVRYDGTNINEVKEALEWAYNRKK